MDGLRSAEAVVRNILQIINGMNVKSAGQMFTVSESKNNLLLLGFIPIKDLILNTLGFWALNDFF